MHRTICEIKLSRDRKQGRQHQKKWSLTNQKVRQTNITNYNNTSNIKNIQKSKQKFHKNYLNQGSLIWTNTF